MEQFLEDFIFNIKNLDIPDVELYGEKDDLYYRFEQALKICKKGDKKAVWFLREFDNSVVDKNNTDIVFLCRNISSAEDFLKIYPGGFAVVCPCILGIKHNGVSEDGVYISDVFESMCNISEFSGNNIFKCSSKISQSDALEIDTALNENPNEIFVFSDAKSKEFKKLQSLQLRLLNELDRVCRENDIEYFLAGGTLLGACRHKGFIPWDYDIDVMMTPENFRRFCSLSEKFGKEYFLQTPKTDKNNHFFTKLRLNGTQMTTPMTDKLKNIHNGIFIDIFEHSYTADSVRGQKIHRLLTKTFRSLVYNKWNGSAVKGAEGQELGKLESTAATFLKTILPMKFLEYMQFFIIDFFKKPKKYMYDGMGQNLNRGVFPSGWLRKKTFLEFEGKKYPVPKEYKKYLKFLYGDYMSLPPCSQRHISHEIVNLDFGRYK